MGKTKKQKVVVSTAAEAIEFFGGSIKTSEALFGSSVKRAMVSMWKARGKIPGDWRNRVAAEIIARGGKVAPSFHAVVPGNGFVPVADALALTDDEKAFAPDAAHE